MRNRSCRASSEALRSGALRLLQDKLQSLVHGRKAPHPSQEPLCHSSPSLPTAGGGARAAAAQGPGKVSQSTPKVDTGVGDEGVNVQHLVNQVRSSSEAATHAGADEDAGEEERGRALFDMGRDVGAGSSRGKRARAALQSAWGLD